MAVETENETADESHGWRRWAATFAAVWLGGLVGSYLLIILIDPYGLFPYSLPMDRPVVDHNQRFMYAGVVTSRRYDSIVVGTSTAGLLDPQLLSDEFGSRFANLTMASASAWEQQAIVNFFINKVGPPKVLVVGLDNAWCARDAGSIRSARDFPEWMYDENPWNDHLYLLNTKTMDLVRRLIAYHLGLYKVQLRPDGFQSFMPPESHYDLRKARQLIWRGRTPVVPPDTSLVISFEEKAAMLKMTFEALPWLEAVLAKLPTSTRKVLAFMPVHVAAMGDGDRMVECKDRLAIIARRYGATLIDWRISSVLTREDSNYWDYLHFRLPVADRVVRDMASAVLHGRPSRDDTYKLIVP